MPVAEQLDPLPLPPGSSSPPMTSLMALYQPFTDVPIALAPASAIALMNAASKAYSMRSWPRVCRSHRRQERRSRVGRTENATDAQAVCRQRFSPQATLTAEVSPNGPKHASDEMPRWADFVPMETLGSRTSRDVGGHANREDRSIFVCTVR